MLDTVTYSIGQSLKSVTVVTPTIGGDYFSECLESVLKQDYGEHFQHLVVFDGPEVKRRITTSLYGAATIELPWNVGGNGWYGHRVYAAIGHLINTDAVMLLDEDNMFEANHISKSMDCLNSGDYDFVFSNRKICEKDTRFVCMDRFESIGDYPLYHVDTSSYCFKTDFFRKVCHIWDWKWGADRRFFQAIRDKSKWASTGDFTMIYRLDGNPGSPTRDFFENGNVQAGWRKDGKCEI